MRMYPQGSESDPAFRAAALLRSAGASLRGGSSQGTFRLISVHTVSAREA